MNTDHRTDPAERAQKLIEAVIEQEDIDPLDEEEVYDEAMELAERACCYREVEPYLRESTQLMKEQRQRIMG